jgi:hypothetical protein
VGKEETDITVNTYVSRALLDGPVRYARPRVTTCRPYRDRLAGCLAAYSWISTGSAAGARSLLPPVRAVRAANHSAARIRKISATGIASSAPSIPSSSAPATAARNTTIGWRCTLRL